jgi:hypothetical protein
MSALPNPDARPGERARRARLHDIRAGLPGQLRRARLTTASLVYGPLSSLESMHRRIAHTLPWRLGGLRRTKVTPIAEADVAIPDDVLLKYDDAAQLGVFSQFLIVRPAYYWSPRGSCWLVACVAESERWAVIASWAEDQEGE